MAMEWTLLVQLLQVCGYLLQYRYHVYTLTTPTILSSQVSGTVAPKTCFVDFYKKSASCKGRNLKDVTIYLPSDIQILDLSGNYIQALHNHYFRPYVFLLELDLSFNNIQFIETRTFFPLVHLRKLDLTSNEKLTSIHSEIFRWSAKLFSLNFSGCKLNGFPNDTLKWLPQLEELSLSNNPIRFINISFCPHKTMRMVSLAFTRLEIISEETFSFTCKCETLFLQSNSLHDVDPNIIAKLTVRTLWVGLPPTLEQVANTSKVYTDLFMGVAGSSIEEVTILKFDCSVYIALEQLANKTLSRLALKHGSLEECINQSSVSLPRVNRLIIVDTNIEVIRPEFFNGVGELVELDLSNNIINTINASFSTWNIAVNTLNLSGNMITDIQSDAFDGLKNLSYLDLSNNRCLFYLDISIWNLKYLNISGTSINLGTFHVPQLIGFSFSWRLSLEYKWSQFFGGQDRFQNTLSLQRIVLSYSDITLDELWDPFNKKSLFQDLKNLTVLDLQENDLRSLQYGMFPHLVSLYELDLSQCKISIIEKNTFADLYLLAILRLQENEITILPPYTFNTTRQLRSLYIHSNLLSDLHQDLFAHIPNLTTLTIAGNELIRLSPNIFNPIQSTIESIDLSDNPFDCSCQLKWLVEWLKNSEDILQLKKATCSPALDNTMHGKSLTKINPNILCVFNVYIYCLTAFVVIALVSVIIIAYHKRWSLKHNIFLLKLAVLGYREMQDTRDHSDFLFDLNIMFNNYDEVWTKEYFRKNIKEQLPQFQRITFGDDDLPLGMYYLDAVLYVIEHSFKTILLLSRYTTRDNEFMMKLRVALNQITNTDVQRIILVFLEDIPDEEMPYLVKLFLSEQMPYIYWMQDQRGQKYFWKQLVKSLTLNNLRRSE